jgi:hypothetical protein
MDMDMEATIMIMTMMIQSGLDLKIRCFLKLIYHM